MTMQITETKSDGLSREYKIILEAKEIEEKVNFKLKEMAQSARLPGFRPGKVPPKILRQRYGSQVIGEVLERAIGDSSRQALDERGIRPISQPDIQVTSFDEGKDLEYTISVEIFPKIDLMDFSKISLERLEPTPDEAQLKEALSNIAKANKTTIPISKKRKSKIGDVVIIDFVGKVNGEEFPGGAATGYSLELGSNSFIPGFEEQLTGHQAGENVKVSVEFPAEYEAADLAGKKAVFDCTIHEIHEAQSADIDDKLAKKVGMNDLNALKEAIQEEQGREFRHIARMRVKRQLLDILENSHEFDIPKKMAEGEYKNILTQLESQKSKDKNETGKPSATKPGKKKLDPSEETEYRAIAKRRIKLGLLLSEIGRSNNIDVSQEDINQAMMEEAKKDQVKSSKFLSTLRKTLKQLSISLPQFMRIKLLILYLKQQKLLKKRSQGMIY